LPSRPQKGRLAIVTNAGRDAVDVDAPLTNGAEADGEVVWSRRLEVGVKLAEVDPPMTVSIKSDHRGEHEVNVKTIVQEGCIARPAFPAPSVSQGKKARAPLGRIAPRDRGFTSLRGCVVILQRSQLSSPGIAV
jgi:hypothetical protein